MKKKNLNSLNLNKKSISNFSNKIKGGALSASYYYTGCREEEEEEQEPSDYSGGLSCNVHCDSY